MKRMQWILTLMLTVLPGLAAAQLHSSDKIVAQVPFEFVVANKIVPAGQYAVQSVVQNGTVLMIRNTDARVGVFSADSLSETREASGTYALVFKKYGNQHFLWKIKIKGSRVACQLPESKAEAEMQAKSVPSTEEVLLAALK